MGPPILTSLQNWRGKGGEEAQVRMQGSPFRGIVGSWDCKIVGVSSISCPLFVTDSARGRFQVSPLGNEGLACQLERRETWCPFDYSESSTKEDKEHKEGGEPTYPLTSCALL